MSLRHWIATTLSVVMAAALLGTSARAAEGQKYALLVGVHNYSEEKVLHPLAGWPMLRHVIENVSALKPQRIVGVVGPGQKTVGEAFAPHRTVVQSKPLGTGHAARAALPALEGHDGPVLVVHNREPPQRQCWRGQDASSPGDTKNCVERDTDAQWS